MKYVRTKDYIYDFESYCLANTSKKVLNSIYNGIEDNENIEIIKQADTIEDLCDEFVMLRLKDEFNDDEPIIIKHLDLAKSYFEQYLGYAIYGAIWTEWGLKYVAKMNDKGELELL